MRGFFRRFVDAFAEDDRVWIVGAMLALTLPALLVLSIAGGEAIGGYAAFVTGVLSLVGVLILRWAWRKRKERLARPHAAWVSDVRPLPEEPDDFEPYYIALCECDWFGEPRDSAEDARRDAEAHTANVRPEVERPVG